jgi:hypothetical protein
MNYTEVTFTMTPSSEAIADVLIAELSQIGCDGFSYTDQGFTAYIPSQDYNRKTLDELELLQYFSFICMLSLDVYVKKQLIEKLIDAATESVSDDKKGKK